MSKLLLIAVDLDDTLVATYDYVLPELIKYLRKNGLTEELAYVEEMTKQGKTTMTFRKDISDIIFKEIVEPAHFMRDADPSLLVQQGFFDALHALRSHYGYLIRSVVCTHRGFSPQGKQLSQEWLIKQQASDLFEEVHSIDPKVNPDKIAFLKELYPEYEILLLDDNPFGHKETVREPLKEVLVYDAINKFESLSNQKKFTNLDDFITQCANTIRS